MLPNTKLYNIAHRGARSIAPENTMAAFYKAWQVGAHGVETDVTITSDSLLVLCHDPLLARTTDINRVFPLRMFEPIYSFTWKEIQLLDAGSWFVDDDPYTTLANGSVTQQDAIAYRGERVPLLEELLVFVKEKSWFINIEIKRLPEQLSTFPIVEKVLQLVENAALGEKNFSISSFDHSLIRKVKELSSNIEINALIGEDESIEQDWGEYEFPIYNANVNLTDLKQIQTAQEHGCRINLYTVNNLSDMTLYRRNGVDKIITDYPQLLA